MDHAANEIAEKQDDNLGNGAESTREIDEETGTIPEAIDAGMRDFQIELVEAVDRFRQDRFAKMPVSRHYYRRRRFLATLRRRFVPLRNLLRRNLVHRLRRQRRGLIRRRKLRLRLGLLLLLDSQKLG